MIAKKLGLKAPETVCRWRQRSPAAHAWLLAQLGVRATAVKPLVDRRVAHLAMQGSTEHARIYYQVVAAVGEAGELSTQGDAGRQHGVTINLLVPRPEMPPSMSSPSIAVGLPIGVDAVTRTARR